MKEEPAKKTTSPSWFRQYGGCRALLKSRYLWMALGLSAALYSQWTKAGWWDTVLAVIPNLLGFTIGAFALTLAFGDESFRKLMADDDRNGKPSVMQEMAATFYHFICVQVAALIGAILSKGLFESDWDNAPAAFAHTALLGQVAWWVLYSVFLYAILLSWAAGRWIFLLAQVYNQFLVIRSKKQQDDPPQ